VDGSLWRHDDVNAARDDLTARFTSAA